MSEGDGFVDAIPADYLEPGETATVDGDGAPVTAANAAGTWWAFQSTCPHQSTPLGGIPLVRQVLLRCPEHGSTCDVTTGRCVLPSDDGWSGPLRTYPAACASSSSAVRTWMASARAARVVVARSAAVSNDVHPGLWRRPRQYASVRPRRARCAACPAMISGRYRT